MIYHWLGADAERVWADYIRQVEAEAEALRHPIEEVPE